MAAQEILVVQSKIREVIKKANCNCAGDVAEAVRAEVERLIKAGVARAKANKRKTVKGSDI